MYIIVNHRAIRKQPTVNRNLPKVTLGCVFYGQGRILTGSAPQRGTTTRCRAEAVDALPPAGTVQRRGGANVRKEEMEIRQKRNQRINAGLHWQYLCKYELTTTSQEKTTHQNKLPTPGSGIILQSKMGL